MAKTKVGILVSGRGSNMIALAEAARAADYPADIAVVVSNRPQAPALERAASMGIATVALDHKAFESREAFDLELTRHLEAHGVEWVCLAGYMRLLSPAFVARWQGRMINIHPALLPSFKGLHTHERALAAGVKLHGATVHFVTDALDDGPIIAQGAVPVLAGDTADTLSDRVLHDVEHVLYPLALKAAIEAAAGKGPASEKSGPHCLIGL